MSSHSLVPVSEEQSPHSQILLIVVCWFAGILGIHRFMIGKWMTGLLMLFTGGGFGIWWIIDLIRLAMGRFKDADGLYIGAPNRPVQRLQPPRRPIPSKLGHDKEPDFGDAELMRDPLEEKFDQLRQDMKDGSV